MENYEISELYNLLKKLLKMYLSKLEDSPGGEAATIKFSGNIDEGRRDTLKIGNLFLKGRLVTAPLAGVSDNTFRIFAEAFGSSLNFTEMISSYGVHYKNRQTESLSYITDLERPCGIQIFGSDPDIMAESATILEEKADIIDINMGCPVPKVLKTGSGGYLLTDIKRVGQITKKVRSRIKKPLSIKIRSGWDRNTVNAVEVSKILQDNGADMVTIHPRTVKQGFTGEADYDLAGRVKKALEIPVIVSGDIDSPVKAGGVLALTGCDGAMIGRAAKGRPWIFYDVFDPDAEFKKSFALLYLKFLIFFYQEEKAVREFRKYFAWIFRTVRNTVRLRQEFNFVEDYEGAERIIQRI
jgi:tRNA-dihydrouridine synthase B